MFLRYSFSFPLMLGSIFNAITDILKLLGCLDREAIIV